MKRVWCKRLLTVALFALVACAETPDEDGTITVSTGLDGGAYKTQVHPVFEKACGKSDCHGNLPRGLRIYGASALRLPGATGPTTPDEIRATFESIEGLEPEKLDAFLGSQPRTKEQAYKLLLLGKPLQLERHRGGISLRKGEPAEVCITSWLLGTTDATASRNVDVLERQGLAERRPDPEDARGVIVAATSEGLADVRRRRRQLERLAQRALDGLTPDEARRVADAIVELQTLLDRR